MIVVSWFVSPIMSGIVSLILLVIIKKLIYDARNPLKVGLMALPIIYGLTVFINVLTVTLNGSKREWGASSIFNVACDKFTNVLVLAMENLALWEVLAISTGAMVITAVLCQLFMVPWQRKKILSETNDDALEPSENRMEGNAMSSNAPTVSKVSVEAPVLEIANNDSDANVNKLFHFLQTLTAVFSSFAHGGNDVWQEESNIACRQIF